MYARTLVTAIAVVAPLVAVLGSAPVGAADGESVEGRVWYKNSENPDWSMDLEVVDGVVVPTELQGGERVKVLLLGEPLDRQKFLDAMVETGNMIFMMTRLRIDKSVSFDVCRSEDGSGAQICGVGINGPGLSMSKSGFGVYGDFTEFVSFEDGRVKAKLKTVEPIEGGSVTHGFDLSFDLPITEYEEP